MIKRTIGQLKKMIPCETAPVFDEITISGVSTDSRTLQAGNLFIPLVGETFDGHRFARQAIDAGAAALLWQADREDPPTEVPVIFVQDTLRALQQLAAAYRRELPVRIVGVTGSNGKTTTKDMIAACLATTYTVHKTEGNLNNHIGLPLTLLAMKEETQMAVLEMGMSARGEISLLSSLARPEVAVITNIGEAHLEHLGSREEIAAAKLEIIEGMKEDGLLIYNGDEPLIEERLEKMDVPSTLLRFRFGTDDTNDYYPLAKIQQENRTSFKLNVPFSMPFTIPIAGRHNVQNALAAIACSRYMGVLEADIVRGLREMTVTGMRSEFVQARSGATLINDAYNASPTSMQASLLMLLDLKTKGRKIAVLGDMLELGEREEEYHRNVAKLLEPDKIDYVFTYGKLAALIAGEAAKVYPSGHVRAFFDKDELSRELDQLLQPGDLCLFKGSRGMKLEDIVEKLV